MSNCALSRQIQNPNPIKPPAMADPTNPPSFLAVAPHRRRSLSRRSAAGRHERPVVEAQGRPQERHRRRCCFLLRGPLRRRVPPPRHLLRLRLRHLRPQPRRPLAAPRRPPAAQGRGDGDRVESRLGLPRVWVGRSFREDFQVSW